MLRFLLSIGLVFTLAGCVTMADFQNLQNRVNTLERSQQQTIQKNQARIQELEQQFTALQEDTSHLVSNRTESMRSHQANLWSEFENMRVDVATLQGKMEQVQYNVSQLQSQSTNQTQTLSELEEQVQRLDKQLDLAGSQLGLDLEDGKENSSTKPGEIKDTRDSESASAPQMLYEKALNSFHNREYDQAKELWAEFTSQFPEHDLVPNAYFWQGECSFQMEKYAQAVLLYDEVINKYKESGKYPSALLKQGLALYALDKKKAGRIRLQQLIKSHADTAEAKRATTFLDQQ
jgi:tol-pal system protein YbgF